jgi:hypothetical protein
MARKTESDEIRADLASVEALLGAVPEGDILGRRSLTARRDILAHELATLPAQAQPSAHAAVYFGGAPVVGSRGIDATFASKALANYEDFVTKIWAQRQHGNLPASGPVRDRHEARLHITGVVRGSFGFELAELEGSTSFEGAPLRDAVDLATRAIIAAGESDDALADAAEDLDSRAFAALREFFTVLKKGGASVRVVTDDLDRSFDVSAVLAATERTQGTLTEQQDVPVPGEFLGVLPERRTFEFRRDDGTVLRGRVSEEMPLADLRQLNPSWATRRCIAHLRVVTLTSRARSRQRYILRRLADEPLK